MVIWEMTVSWTISFSSILDGGSDLKVVAAAGDTK